MNIFSPIGRNGRAFPDRVALLIDGKPMTYGQMLRVTGLVCARLAAAGISRGDTVALAILGPAVYVLTALAVARMGAVVSPFDVSWPKDQVDSVLRRHQVRAVVHDFGDDRRPAELAEDRFLRAKDLMTVPAAGTSLPVPPVAADVGAQPWIIALSSGTTGMPKSIPHSHDRALLYACMPMVQSDQADLERVLVWVSLHVAMAMNTVLNQLVCGRTVVLASHREPENFFAVAQRDRPTYVATSTGNAIRLVAYAAQSMPDSRGYCGSISGISLAGSSASPALCAQIAQYICPNLEINYGGSEPGRVAQATAQTLAVRPDSAGRLREWVEMEATDDFGQALPPGEPGVLRVRSPLVVNGYLDDPQTTAQAFLGGWYYPGDTGKVDEAGYLTLTGRVDHLLNLGGNKIDPFVIEALLDAQPGVGESAVLAIPMKTGATILVALVVSSGPWEESALKKICNERLGRHRTPARILSTKSFPRNAGGKVMRDELAALLTRRLDSDDGTPTLH